jgi:hypothetical protein
VDGAASNYPAASFPAFKTLCTLPNALLKYPLRLGVTDIESEREPSRVSEAYHDRWKSEAGWRCGGAYS